MSTSLFSCVSKISPTGNPLRGFPTKNIPLECFSTLLRFVKHKVFRSLRRATKGSAFGNCKPLKRLDLNFECLGEVHQLIGSSLGISSTASTNFSCKCRARLVERFRVLGAAARRLMLLTKENESADKIRRF